jgi:hypothetical protein
MINDHDLNQLYRERDQQLVQTGRKILFADVPIADGCGISTVVAVDSNPTPIPSHRCYPTGP